MTHKKLTLPLLAAAALAAIAGTLIAADSDPAASADFPLPPGWTEGDLQACMMAGTPGQQHKLLAEGVGVWHGESTMWMAPGSDPVTSECTSTVTTIMDGRYVKVEMDGEMPGMGPYDGFGLYGFDNVSQEFVATWIDNHSTGIMTGKGDQSDGGKKLSWEFTANCPITKKPVTIREVETVTGADTKTLEMWGVEPKSGEEFKMMSIKLTRKK